MSPWLLLLFAMGSILKKSQWLDTRKKHPYTIPSRDIESRRWFNTASRPDPRVVVVVVEVGVVIEVEVVVMVAGVIGKLSKC